MVWVLATVLRIPAKRAARHPVFAPSLPARVIVLDVNDEKLEFAKSVGAHEAVLSDASAAENVRKMAGAAGAIRVLDFVGFQPTVAPHGGSPDAYRRLAAGTLCGRAVIVS